MTMLEGFYNTDVLNVENAALSSSGTYIVPSHGEYQVKGIPDAESMPQFL